MVAEGKIVEIENTYQTLLEAGLVAGRCMVIIMFWEIIALVVIFGLAFGPYDEWEWE